MLHAAVVATAEIVRSARAPRRWECRLRGDRFSASSIASARKVIHAYRNHVRRYGTPFASTVRGSTLMLHMALVFLVIGWSRRCWDSPRSPARPSRSRSSWRDCFCCCFSCSWSSASAAGTPDHRLTRSVRTETVSAVSEIRPHSVQLRSERRQGADFHLNARPLPLFAIALPLVILAGLVASVSSQTPAGPSLTVLAQRRPARTADRDGVGPGVRRPRRPRRRVSAHGPRRIARRHHGVLQRARPLC